MHDAINRRSTVYTAFGGMLLVAACSADADRRSGLTSSPSLGTGIGDDMLTSGEAKGGDEASDGDSGGADGSDGPTAPLFDLGVPAPDDGVLPEGGCTKVDFLFVIDNSRSMQGKQEALAATFEPFMLAIEENLDTSDVHVMVVDTDAATLCTEVGCANAGVSGPVYKHCLDGDETDGGYACQAAFQPCDSVLGAGVVHPAGNYASNMPCAVAGDKRYLDGTDDLVHTFDCIARVGTAGDKRERPMDAMVAAVDPANACNAGFLRDDAILVVVIITDDQCREDAGTPETWKAALVDAKGDEGSIVVLGLLPNQSDCQHAPDACDSAGDVIDGQHWHAFVESWEHGITGVVCDTAQFATLFDEAVGVIATTCDEFEPPG